MEEYTFKKAITKNQKTRPTEQQRMQYRVMVGYWISTIVTVEFFDLTSVIVLELLYWYGSLEWASVHSL